MLTQSHWTFTDVRANKACPGPRVFACVLPPTHREPPGGLTLTSITFLFIHLLFNKPSLKVGSATPRQAALGSIGKQLG